MIKSAEGSAGLLHKITKPTAWKEDEKEKMEEMHQQKVTQMIKSAEGSAGLLHKITMPTAWKEEHRS